MTNPVAPSTSLTIGNATFQLLYSFEAVAAAEDATDRALLTGLRSRDISSPSISLVRAMLYAAVLPLNPKVTLAEVKALVTRKNLSDIWTKVLNAWSAGMAEPDADEADEDTDPRTDQS
jgi:hypothetical protein